MRTVLRPFSHNLEHASGLFKRPGRSFCSAAALTAVLCITGCSPHQKQLEAPQDKPLAAYQNEMLDLAFETATMIPVNPHVKDRSKAQETVATLCFELDQPQRALGYIEKISDWRRGAGYADYAFYCAQHGITNEVQHYLNLAGEISSVTDQDWGRDRIKIKISRTHTLLGQDEQADQFSKGVDAAESGKVARVEATLCMEDAFEAQRKTLDGLIDSGNFDLVKNALYAYAELFNRFYGNTERRSQIEEKIKTVWKPLPLFIRVELLLELADFALGHADKPEALVLVNDAKAIVDSVVWPPEHQISLEARIAAYRFRSGDEEAARSAAAGLLTLYNERQSEIINIDKAETLSSVAEAFQVMGDTAVALTVYKQAVEAAIENPNSRPRAEDLSAICLSMVKHRVEPTAALSARIREIKSSLGDPW